MLQADPSKVSSRAKKRGLPQLGTLGAGNHYAEIQVVDEIYNDFAARKMGIEEVGQVCVMIHCGSRGLGHQVATGKFTLYIVDDKLSYDFDAGKMDIEKWAKYVF